MRSVGWLVAIACVFVFPTAARAPHMAVLDRNPFTATVQGGNINSGQTALTVTVISGLRATQQVYATATPGGGDPVTLVIPIGSNATRVVLDVAPPVGGSATLQVEQGARQYVEPVAGDTSFVFDISPGF
jgi:hypothetical protein